MPGLPGDRESQARLEAIFAQAGVGLWETTLEGRFIRANEEVCHFLGRSQAEILSSTFAELTHPEDLAVSRENFRHTVESGAPASFDKRYVRPDGTVVWANTSLTRLVDEEGRPSSVLAVTVDLTARAFAVAEQAQAEAALREETRLLETLNRTGAALAAELDLERLVQMVTDAAVELTGARFGAYFHNFMDETGERLHLYTLSGADRSAFEKLGRPRATAIFGPTFRNECVIRSDDILVDPRYGRSDPHRGMPKGHLPVRSYLAISVVSRSGIVLGGLLFGHPEPGRFTARHERLIGGLAAQAAIAIDNARLFQAVQRANETLEERVAERTAELSKAHEALRQAQKMEAVGQLTGGIAHDFNNLLGAVVGSFDLIRRKPDDVERVRRFAEAGLQAAERGAKLTGQLLAFSRAQRIELKPLIVSELVEGMRDMLSRTLGPMVRLSLDLDANQATVLSDPTQLEMAVLNLAINARDAMPEGGDLKLSTSVHQIRKDPELRPGEYVELSVADTGGGMPPEVVARAFDPFFTTKGVGKGTGLGLSQVYGVAQQTGGTVRIESRPGEGSTIRIFLPKTSAPMRASTEIEPDKAVAAENSATILIVDDDPDVRRVLAASLDALGYQVIEAADGPAGLSALEQNTPDLMMVDFAMPGMNGAEVAKVARERRPDLPILFASGYADTAAIENVAGADAVVLRKPFRVDDLQAVLSTALMERTRGAPPVRAGLS